MPKMSELGKLPPQDTDVEEAVLGAIMLETDAYSRVCDILKPECFYDPNNQKNLSGHYRPCCPSTPDRHDYRHKSTTKQWYSR